ncbi:MAG: SMP-30/gluconolactonase/LRE family protein [Bryobacteraceae bacterium]
MHRLFLILGFAACLLRAADDQPRWRVLNQAARQAAQAKDYAKLRAILLELKPLMPGNPRITYNLAASEAMLGQREVSLSHLRDLAGMGLVYDLPADADFTSLKNSPEFAAILARMNENKRPVTHSTPAFTLAENDLLPEDIAYDSKTRRFFVSSVRKAKILTTGGEQFAKADWSVLALAVDPERRILWATTGWVPHCEHCDKADKDKTALLAFDLDSHALKQRIDSPVKGLLGDMTIGRRGDIYVSEGIHGAVFHLKPGGKQLERLDIPGQFPSPQTPALSEDEKTLYVPDYARGIAAIDLVHRTANWRTATWLQPADDIALNGIDGLYVYGNSFLAVQNGTNPPRVMKFSRDLQEQQVLEANTPGLGEPTHGTLVGNIFYVIANTGWSAYDDKGVKKPETAPVQSSIWKIPVSNVIADPGVREH